MSDPSASFGSLPLPSRAYASCTEDLDLDFTCKDRVELSIRIAAATLEGTGYSGRARDWVSGLPLGARIVQLLSLAAKTARDGTLVVNRRCTNDECGEPVELALPLHGLIEYGAAALAEESSLEWNPGQSGRPIELRRCTGDDQRTWQQRTYSSQGEATRQMLETLAIRGGERLGDLKPREFDELAEAMAEFDPLVGFRVITRCPHCAREVTLAIDLEEAALRELHSHQRAVLESIHQLASAYGWTESEILRIPSRRREFYLNRLEAGNGMGMETE